MRIDNEREKRERQEWDMRERVRVDKRDSGYEREILSTNVDLESLCIPNGRKNLNRFYYLDRE